MSGADHTGVTRRDLLASAALGIVAGGPAIAARGRAAGAAELGRAHLAGADLVRPGRDARHHHPLHDDVRAARRGGEADAGQRAWRRASPKSWTASEDALTYDFVLRKGVEVPQRRPGDRRGRQVLVRALSRLLGEDCSRTGWRRSRLPIARHIRFKLKEPWPDFLTLLRERHAAPAGSCRRNTSRRSATTASRRPRSAPVPTSSSRSRRASNW